MILAGTVLGQCSLSDVSRLRQPLQQCAEAVPDSALEQATLTVVDLFESYHAYDVQHVRSAPW